VWRRGALALGDSTGDLVAGRRVVQAAMEDDRVQRPVQLPVAAAGRAAAAGYRRTGETSHPEANATSATIRG
jgi:hypothetical protein